MKTKEQPEVKLLCRYDRLPDGSLKMVKPYRRGVRDDRELLERDCLAFETDLSCLCPERRKKYLAFEEAYVQFYRVWTGSYALPGPVSRALDVIQADMEHLRKELTYSLTRGEDIAPDPMS
jgi:hypothetical protein